MKISVITSVYNNKDTIKDAIDSVLSQSYNNIEYIVIDGASVDGTIEVIKSYGSKITKFITEKDRGIYDGLNKGIEESTGDIVAFLHSDDLYASNTIVEEIVNLFNKDNSLDAVYADLIYTQKNNTDKILRYWKSKNFNKKLLKNGWMPAHPTLFLKKNIYEKYGNFDLNFKIAADYDFMLRILKNDINIKYYPKIVYKMRVGGESNKSIKNIILKSKEDLKALRKNKIGGLNTLIYKNLSKVRQFLFK